MPKKTFYNLSLEKQNVIIEAAKKEFSRVPVSEASIANIVTTAGIARGSFYQYFESKEDLFDFVFESVRSLKSYLERELKKDKIDLFLINEGIYRHLIKSFYKSENKSFAKELFKNLKVSEMDYLKLQEKCKTEKTMFLKKIDRSVLNTKTEEELLSLVYITFFTTRGFLAKSINYDNIDDAIQAYLNTLNLLKTRFMKS